jgi:hypothetical protein
MNTNVRSLIILICSCLFVFLTYKNLTTYLKYPTAQTTSEKTLSQVEFPTVEICVNPGYDVDFLRSQGYEELWHYVNGWLGKDTIGWAGNGTMTTKELIEKAYTWKNETDIVTHAGFHDDAYYSNLTQPDYSLILGLQEEEMHYPEGKCFRVTGIKDKMKANGNVEIDFEFRNVVERMEVSVFITDPHREYWKRDMFSYSGVPIKWLIGNSTGKTIDVYHLKVSETEDLEDDHESLCEDYFPITAYGRCVETSTQQDYLDTLGCVPPWFWVSSSHNVCQGKSNITYGHGLRVPITQMDIRRVQVKDYLHLKNTIM